MLNFYDFEVFKEDWLVVIINPDERSTTTIVNDADKLKEYYEAHKEEIWVGYNNIHYDQYIFKSILCGFNPKEVNDFIIRDGKKGYQFSNLFRKIKMINYDVFIRNDGGLKSLEGFMGNNIHETSVPFDIDRKLTANEIKETVKYCTHDVEQTIEVFLERIADFEAHKGLISAFNLPLSSMDKTKAQLVAQILEAKRPINNRDDEFDIEFADTIEIKKYRDIVDWYKNPLNLDYSKSLEVDVAGVPHIFAWGGIHGAIPQYQGEGLFVNIDVESYYPSMILRYGWMSRNVASDTKYRNIYNTRLDMKHKKMKKEQLPYKTVLNTTYGCMKDKFNNLYDPRQANNICVNGQLLLLDLIEKLEPYFDIIQSNTDGVLVKLRNEEDYGLLDDICYEWEERTGMKLEFDEFVKVFQKDVNNYILVDADGNYKSKGAYVKKLSNLDYDLPIVNEALVNYMVKGISIERTINECNDLKKFQKIVKVSGKYMYGMYGNEILTDRCFRVFASNRVNDKGIFKRKSLDKNPEKFANTPEKCFIDNTNINDKKVPQYLDREWYIEMSKNRLSQFGVGG